MTSEGGSKWELERAAKRLADATGNPDAAEAALDLAAALNNGVSATLIPTLQQVLGSVVKHEIGTLAVSLASATETQDRRFDYILSQLDAFLKKEDHRHDIYAAELDQISASQVSVLAELRGVSADMGKFNRELDDLRSHVAIIYARHEELDGIQEWRAGVDRRLAGIEQADRDDIRSEIKDIKASLAQYEQKHQELLARLEQRHTGNE